MKRITFGSIARSVVILEKRDIISFHFFDEKRFDQNTDVFRSDNEPPISASKSSIIIYFHTFSIIISNHKWHSYRQDESKMLAFKV